MTSEKLSCAAVRAARADIRRSVRALAREEADLLLRCAHDEARTTTDYQDPRPYWTCTGCGKSFTQRPAP